MHRRLCIRIFTLHLNYILLCFVNRCSNGALVIKSSRRIGCAGSSRARRSYARVSRISGAWLLICIGSFSRFLLQRIFIHCWVLHRFGRSLVNLILNCLRLRLRDVGIIHRPVIHRLSVTIKCLVLGSRLRLNSSLWLLFGGRGFLCVSCQDCCRCESESYHYLFHNMSSFSGYVNT